MNKILEGLQIMVSYTDYQNQLSRTFESQDYYDKFREFLNSKFKDKCVYLAARDDEQNYHIVVGFKDEKDLSFATLWREE